MNREIITQIKIYQDQKMVFIEADNTVPHLFKISEERPLKYYLPGTDIVVTIALEK